MNTSVIRHRVADFLRRHAPFDALPDGDLLLLAGSGRVKFHEADEPVYEAGQARQPRVWIIQQGRVELIDERSHLRDVLGEGDLLGLDRFSGNGSYTTSARTASDVILYSLDAAIFEDVVSRHSSVERYLAAHFSVTQAAVTQRTSWLDAEFPPHDFLVARTHASSAPGDLPTAAAPTTRDAVRALLQSRTQALSLANGASPAILTASDLALFCGRNPALLLSEILRAGSAEELRTLLLLAGRQVMEAMVHQTDVDDCGFMATEMWAVLAAACIRLAESEVTAAGLDHPEVPYCWLTFGALARGEMLRVALPNLAVVYDDSHDANTATSGAYFAAVAGQTASWFHACGIEGAETAWPEGAHPCMPLSEWKRFFSETIRDPLHHDLYARRELFDFRPLSGAHAIARELHNSIIAELQNRPLMVSLLANDTLAHQPPLTFLGGLVIDLDGGHRHSFDLSAAAVRPITDAARVFTLGGRHAYCSGTLDRLAAEAANDPAHATVFREAADAFRIAMFHTAVANTSWIKPGQIGRYEQRLLKTALTSVRRLLELTQSVFCGV